MKSYTYATWTMTAPPSSHSSGNEIPRARASVGQLAGDRDRQVGLVEGWHHASDAGFDGHLIGVEDGLARSLSSGVVDDRRAVDHVAEVDGAEQQHQEKREDERELERGSTAV